MNDLKAFLTESLPTLLFGGLGGGGLLILIQYLVPSYKDKIKSQEDVLDYVNKELKKRDKQIEILKKHDKLKDKKIQELEIKYQLSKEEIEMLKQYISNQPDGVDFLKEVEKKIAEKRMFLKEINSLNTNITQVNIKAMLLMVFVISFFISIVLIYGTYRASESSNILEKQRTVEKEKEILQLQLQLQNNK